MKILLTGSHGFIGTHFRKKSGFKNVVCWDKKQKEKDIKNITLEDLQGVDVIVHLAGSISGKESWQKPVEYAENNTINTIRLLWLAKEAKVKKFIFASSAAVHGYPLTPYGASKLAVEKFIQSFDEQDSMPWTIILRFFNVYGNGQNSEYAGVISKFMDALKNGEELIVNNYGKSTRDFVYIDDVIKTLVRACKTTRSAWTQELIEVGTGKDISIKSLANLMRKLFNKNVKTSLVYTSEAEILKSKANKSLLLHNKFTTLEEGLIKMVWERNQK